MSKTLIDPKKVNVAEADVEQWLFENPSAVPTGFGGHVVRWLKRQYRVPSGVIDLLGIDCRDRYVVVEIKNTEINAEALAQVCRYAEDIENIMLSASDDTSFRGGWNIQKVVIGKDKITSETQFEADAMGIVLSTFRVEFELIIGGPWVWTEEYRNKLWDQYAILAKDDVFNLARDIAADIAQREKLAASEVVKEAQRIIEQDNLKEV